MKIENGLGVFKRGGLVGLQAFEHVRDLGNYNVCTKCWGCVDVPEGDRVDRCICSNCGTAQHVRKLWVLSQVGAKWDEVSLGCWLKVYNGVLGGVNINVGYLVPLNAVDEQAKILMGLFGAVNYYSSWLDMKEYTDETVDA